MAHFPPAHVTCAAAQSAAQATSVSGHPVLEAADEYVSTSDFAIAAFGQRHALHRDPSKTATQSVSTVQA